MKKVLYTAFIVIMIMIGVVSTAFAAESNSVILNGFLDYNGHALTVWNKHPSITDNIGKIVGDVNSKTKIVIADQVANTADLASYNWKRATIRVMAHVVDTRDGKKFICDNIYILSRK